MSILAKVAKGVLITAAFLSLFAGTASASDPCSTNRGKIVEETVDGWFGDFIFSPMAAFCFTISFSGQCYPMGHGFSTRYDGLTEDNGGCHAGVPRCCIA